MALKDSAREQDVPVSLDRDTIVEFIHELRFMPTKSGVGELLPGILSQKLAEDFPNYQRLPIANLPSAIRERDPAMEFVGLHRLFGERQSLVLGERVVTLSILPPYPSWREVLVRIERLRIALMETRLIREVERISVRYSNLIPCRENLPQLAMLKVRLELDGFQLGDAGIHIRAEIPTGRCQSIVQVLPHASATIPGRAPIEGLLLDVDTLLAGPFADFWNEYPALLEQVHLAEKRVFFGLLSDETLQGLGPKWRN